MKHVILVALAAMFLLVLTGCGESRDSVQPGSPQWEAAHDTTQQDARNGKDVTIHVPSSMIHPGAGGPPPSNVKIVADPGK